MYSMIFKMKFACVVDLIYACLFTTWRQNTFLTNESSAAQTSYQQSIWLCTANDPLCTANDSLCTANDNIMVILHYGWELHSWKMSHSPKHFDEITSLFSASCPFGKLSVRQNVCSAKRPFGKMSVRQNVRRQNVRSAKCLSAKCLLAKCPGTQYIMCVITK
jgi:hypothetical protein